MDEGCSYPIQQGAKLSRARVFAFKHNDAVDLEALLERIEADEARDRCVLPPARVEGGAAPADPAGTGGGADATSGPPRGSGVWLWPRAGRARCLTPE